MKEITQNDIDLINKIAKRALILLNWSEENVKLDIGAVATGEGLDLANLYEFDDENFTHDIVGINQNLNRETFMLDNNFLPRCG